MLKFTIHLSQLIACLGFLGFASASGQAASVPAPPATNAPATNAPAAIPPATPIALADVVAQAQLTTAQLRDDQSLLGSDQIAQIISENLPVLTREVDERSAEDQTLLGSSPSLSSLQNSQASWQSLSDSLTSSEKALSDRARQVDIHIAKLSDLAKTWQATLDSAQKTSAPKEIVQHVLRSEVVLQIETTQIHGSLAEQRFAIDAIEADPVRLMSLV